jgi:hypothetical protein
MPKLKPCEASNKCSWQESEKINNHHKAAFSATKVGFSMGLIQ